MVVQVFRKDIAFVVDISGSMRGKPLDDTKSVLSAALSKLDPEDSFCIIAFNGQTFVSSTSMKSATKEAVEKAIEWIGINLIAGGDTDILTPLNQVLSRAPLPLCDFCSWSSPLWFCFWFFHA